MLEIKRLCNETTDPSTFPKKDSAILAFRVFRLSVCRQSNECNCESESDIWDLRQKISKLERQVSSAESSNSGQLVLRKNIETEKNNLQIAKRNLESRLSDLQSSNWSLQSANSSLSTELERRDKDVEWGKRELVKTQSDRDNYKNKWVLSENEVRKITDSFNILQIESNDKDNEISAKEEKIISLKVKLGEAEEDILHRELVSKEKKLDELTRNLAIEPQSIKELREAYERLIKAREDYNRGNVVATQREIDAKKQELLQTDISVDNLYKVYRNCEKVAEVRIKLEKIHEERFEARQEVPPHH